MDKKNECIKLCYAVISNPVYLLARILIITNLFDLNEDYKKILSFKTSKKKFQPVLLEALIAGEDHRFYLHFGFDPIAVIRAFWNVCINDKRQGGSTVEQQLVRVITNKYEITYFRKFREILLSTVLIRLFTKEEVLNTYLTVAYFGWRMNGIDEVFERLKISGSEVTYIQACSIIARLKYPEPKILSAQIREKINIRETHIYLKLNKKRCVNTGLTRPIKSWWNFMASTFIRLG